MSQVTEMQGRILKPDELAVVQGVFSQLKAGGYLKDDAAEQEALATYVLKMYARGMVIPENLYELCLQAAKARIDRRHKDTVGETHFLMCKVLIVEDDYFLASNLRDVFEEAGAVVLGPVSSEIDALSLLHHDVPDLAIIDLNLGSGVRFQVADQLQQQSVPFCIHTGYSRANFPYLSRSLRQVTWLDKPALPQTVLRSAAATLAG